MKAPFFRSKIFGGLDSIDHVFSTRIAGSSVGGSKNKSANIEVLAHEVGVPKESIFWSRQVHGAHCLVLKEKDDATVAFETEADSIITDRRGIMIGVKTADCCPILMASSSGAIAAVHAGWKGTLSANLARAIERMEEELSVDRQSIMLAIGPAIGRCCYSIDEERADAFREKFSFADVYLRSRKAKTYLDLKGLNYKIALESGIAPNNVDVSPHCTFCDCELFYSFRRDGERSGRHYSGIMISD